MKTIFILFLILFSSFSWSQAGRKGVGIMLGNPTGLNGKYWLSDSQAIDVGAGFSFGLHTNFSLHSDFLLHKEGFLIFKEDYPLDLYYGVGGRMEFADDIEVGLRVPVGTAYRLEDKNADIFLELAPIWDFVSRTGLELHLLAGARYYF